MDCSGKFKATVFWNEMLHFVISHSLYHSKKVKKKQIDYCVLDHEIVDAIHVFLQRKNGDYINVYELTRENAEKVLKKMVNMDILLPVQTDKTKSSYYTINSNHKNIKLCTLERKICMNPRIPSCSSRNAQENDNLTLKGFVEYGVEFLKPENCFSSDLLHVNQTNSNQKGSQDEKFKDISNQKKRRSLLSAQELHASIAKVRCVRRRSYNLANRHSGIYSSGGAPLSLIENSSNSSLNYVQPLARLLYEFDIPMLEDILEEHMNNYSMDPEYAFENKMFSENELSVHENGDFINAALQCLSVIPKHFHLAKTIHQKKLICFEALREFYGKKSIICDKFKTIFVCVSNCVISRQTTSSGLTPFDLCDIFLLFLPLASRHEILALVNLIYIGSQESCRFLKQRCNTEIFLDFFAPAIFRNTSVSYTQVFKFAEFLVRNKLNLIRERTKKMLNLPKIVKDMSEFEMKKRSKAITESEIKLQVKYIAESSSLSSSKKKGLTKHLSKCIKHL